MGPKGSLPFVTFGHSDQVICMLQINFCIDASLPGSVEKVRYQWKRIPILLSDLIETSEVNTESEGAISFLDKQYRCAMRGPRWADEARS